MAHEFRGDINIARGLGVASMTTVARVAYTPAAAGYTVYDSDVHSLYTWDGATWFSGKDRVHADDTTVAPATTASPTLTEIQTFITTGLITDTLVYYTGDNLPASGATHAYSVDGSGIATTMTEPGSNSIGSWSPSTAYLFDAIVSTPSGALVSKIGGGTTGIAPYDTAEATLWTLIQNGPHLPAYPGTGVYVYAGQTMFDAVDSILYQRTASGDTASGTFDVTEKAFWTRISAHDDLTSWVAATDYTAGHNVITPSGAVVTLIADGTSTAQFDATEAALWTLVGQIEILPFAATTYYYAGTRATDSGRVMVHGAGAISAATFDITEAANWTYESQNNIGAFAAATVVVANELMVDAGVIYQRTATGTTGATFDDTEEALWTRLTAKGAATRIHVTDTAVGPANSIKPTLTEVQAVIDAANTADAGSFVNALTYYTGDDLPASPATYVYWTDNAGIATVIETPEPFSFFSWQPNYYYETGTHVLAPQSNAILKRFFAGTSAATFILDTGQWQMIHNGPLLTTFPVSTYIYAGLEYYDAVTRAIYYRTTNGTTAATFILDVANWTRMAELNDYIDDWSATTYYKIGQSAIAPDGSLISAVADFTSSAAFDATEATAWALFGQVEVLPFTGSTYYFTGSKAIESGRTMFRSAGLAAATFDITEAANWTYDSQNSITAFAATTVVVANQLMVDANVMYQRTATGTTGATFDTAEEALWTRLTSNGGARNRTHVTDSSVGPALTNKPLLAEVQAVIDAANTAVTDSFIDTLTYYTGDESSASTPTYVYWTDNAGIATLIESPDRFGMAAWTASTNYLADTIATTPADAIVSRNTDGTSAGGYGVGESGDWTLIQNGPLLNTFPVSTYIYADQEYYDAVTRAIYRRTTNGTSAATFILDVANWTRMAELNDYIDDWSATTVYKIGQSAIAPDGSLISAVADFTSSAAFDATEATAWTKLGQVEVNAFTGSTYYFTGSKATDNGRTMSRSAGLAAATFDITEAANWTYDSQNSITAFAATTVVVANELMVDSNVLYQRTATGTTGATFDPAEEALWTRITSNGGAKNRTHVTNSAVTPAVFKAPILAEVQAVIDAANTASAGSFVDTLTYYTGDDLPASPTLYAYWTDNAGIATVIETPERDAIHPWAATTFYVLDTMVTLPTGAIIRRNVGGYSGGTFSSMSLSNWDLIQNGPLLTTFPVTTYVFADQEYYDAVTGAIYHRTTGGTTAATFILDVANWTRMAELNDYIAGWTATTVYKIGQVALAYDGSLISAVADFTSSAAFDATEATAWALFGQVEVLPFTGSTYYFTGSRATESGRVMVHGAGAMSAATFTFSEAANWTHESQNSIGVFAAATVVLANDIIVDSNTLWQRTATGTTTATFDATEKAFWTQLTATSVFESTIADATTAWGAAAGGYYTITITAATHGIATPKIMQVYETDGTDFELVQSDRQRILGIGDIDIRVIETPDGRFAGRVEIS
jgi:hypothetical protein